ncbi:MAG: antibiotic biosynthesis monooxygenase [Flavobacteriales bacterium]|nr:antibiotic biosynthesis monooxygenase [Flavobacteriales bacterium]
MIIRIVKMTFKEDKLGEFQRIFARSKEKIRDFAGCMYVEFCQDVNNKNVFFTYSHWASEDALNAYRNSTFFMHTWSETKALFADKPVAHSMERLYSSEQERDV